ncbi:MAG: Pr6Pr family membrane protein [Clostridiales bacterium]|jgi:hypothetical protein|nr:Pr6Pr family membrane protein [Clostridiales bacterium]
MDFYTDRTKKQKIHFWYLIFSAALILSGIATGLFKNGEFSAESLRLFTYQSNILVVLVLVTLAFCDNTKFRYYLVYATTLAITVTGLVYNFVLYPMTENQIVFSAWSNFSLHALSMILMIVNYFVFEQKGNFNVRHLLVGLIFPLLYWIVFISIGGLIDWYPYFFMNPTETSTVMLIVWLTALMTIFLILGYLLVLYDRKYKQKHTKP